MHVSYCPLKYAGWVSFEPPKVGKILCVSDLCLVVISDMVVRQVSPGQTWCLILSLVIVWSSPLYVMPVCPLPTLATLSLGYHAIPICTSGRDVDILAVDILNRGSGMVGPINLVHSPGQYVVMYVHYL